VCDELDQAKPLLEYYKKRLQQHIRDTIIPALRDKDDENLLKIYIKEWKDYTLLTHFMRKMFAYLVRYIINHKRIRRSFGRPQPIQPLKRGRISL
jgi:hypothetical protein